EPVAGQQAGGQPVDHLPHLVELPQLGRPEAGHLDRAVPVGHLDQAFPLQDAEGLPQRRAAHAELLGQLRLEQGGAGRQLLVEDQLAQMRDDVVDQPPAPDRPEVDLTVDPEVALAQDRPAIPAISASTSNGSRSGTQGTTTTSWTPSFWHRSRNASKSSAPG